LNIGLFAKGLDLLPGFGYPAVQYGGWFSPKAIWYRKTAAHNTVVVDGEDQMENIGHKEKESLKEQLNPLKRHQKGKTTLWAIGKNFKAIRVDGKNLHETVTLNQFERTVVLIDMDEADSYILDVFRVEGGKDHAKFFHGYLGDVTTKNLSLSPEKDYGFDTQMTNFLTDFSPGKNWSADWEIYDYYNYLTPKKDVHLIYRDLTSNISASLADTWIAFGFDRGDTLIKSLMIRNKNDSSAATTFVGILEPYENKSKIHSVNRISLKAEEGEIFSDKDVCVGVNFINKENDIIIVRDSENGIKLTSFLITNLSVFPQESSIKTDAELCLIRTGEDKKIKKLVIANGSKLIMAGIELELKSIVPIFEIDVSDDKYSIVSGKKDLLKKIWIGSE